MAQLVEYDLAKVGVAGSSPVSRSSEKCAEAFIYKGFGIFLFEDMCLSLKTV